MTTIPTAELGEALARAAAEPGLHVALIGRTYGVATDRYDDAVTLMSALAPGTIKATRRAAGAQRIDLANGSVIRVLSASSPHSFRGLRLDVAVLVGLTEDDVPADAWPAFT